MAKVARRFLSVVFACSIVSQIHCWCTGEYLITCDRIADIHYDAKPTWEYLILGDIRNSTHRVPNETLSSRTFYNCPHLEELTIIETIDNVETWGFSGLKQLKALKLYNNSLKSLPDVATLSALLKLDFQYNGIETIGGLGAFSLARLKTVNLSHNKLKSFGWRAFDGDVLEDLIVTHNELEELSARNIFPSTLIYLNMSHNKLHHIGESVFEGTDKLQELDLSNNHFTTLWIKYQLRDLNTLDYSYNRITIVEPGIFEGMPNLTRLYLHHNLIKQLPVGVVPTRLNTLHLHNNRMEDLQFLLDDSQLALQQISFAENPLPCDCLDLVLSSVGTKGIQLTNCDYEYFRNGVFPVCIAVNSTSSRGVCSTTQLPPDVYDSFLDTPKDYRC